MKIANIDDDIGTQRPKRGLKITLCLD